MNTHVAVDYESYYDKEVSITTLGTYTYLRHPKCKIYLASIYDGDQRFVGDPADFDWASIAGRVWVSHNRSHDKAVHARLKELGIVEGIDPSSWECTADLAVYLKSPRNLKGACEVLLDREVSKDIRRLMKGIEPEDMPSLCLTDKGKLVPIANVPNFKGPTFWDLVTEYAGEDAVNCWDLWDRYADQWPEKEKRLSRMTTEQAHRGFLVDIPKLKRGVYLLQGVKDRCKAGLPWAPSGDDEEGILSIPAFKKACTDIGVEPPATTSEDSQALKKWELAHPEIQWSRLMRHYRKANILQRRMQHVLDRLTPEGRFPFSWMYGGAHTLRWSGGSREARGGTGESGFNVQNFPKERMWVCTEDYTIADEKETIKKLEERSSPNQDFYEAIDLRACVIAPPGKKLIIADLAQIEPRGLKWITGDTATLARIAAGESIYEVHARNTMGWTGGNIKKENPKMQFIAKQRVLSLGYGCGHVKFRERCLEADVDVPLGEAKQIVKDFRNKEKAIVKLWNRLDSDFKASRGNTYELELPNGRVMTYYDVHAAMRKFGEQTTGKMEMAARVERGGKIKFFYGGLLCENLIQAMCRDIFAETLLALDDAGHTILFHVHDEVILEVDQDVTTHDIEAIMAIAPDWCEGLPVAAEAAESQHYLK